jgi:trigger factor
MTNIQVEDLSSIKKKVTIEVPQEKVLEVVSAQYQDLKKTMQMKGFRRGKVPLEILRSLFKDQVQADAARQMIEEALKSGLDERNIKPLSVLNIDQDSLEEGKAFKFAAEIEVPPHIDAQGYKGLQLKKYVRTLDESKVDEQLQQLRQRHARLSPIQDSRGIATGDHVLVDITAQIDGEKVPALTVSDYHLEMGRNFYLPDFDAHLDGLKPDEIKEITLDLPADFPRKMLAGKTASFHITVKEAKEKVLPALDDDFAKDLGELGTLEDLKENIRKELRTMLDNQSKKELEDQMVDALLKENAFEVPESLIDAEISAFYQQTFQHLVAQGYDASQLPAPSQAYRDQARPAALRMIQRALLFKAIAEKESLEVNDEEVNADMQKKADQLGVSLDFLKDRLEQEDRLDEIRAVLVQEKVFQLIVDQAQVSEEEPPAADQSPEKEPEKE